MSVLRTVVAAGSVSVRVKAGKEGTCHRLKYRVRESVLLSFYAVLKVQTQTSVCRRKRLGKSELVLLFDGVLEVQSQSDKRQ